MAPSTGLLGAPRLDNPNRMLAAKRHANPNKQSPTINIEMIKYLSNIYNVHFLPIKHKFGAVSSLSIIENQFGGIIILWVM